MFEKFSDGARRALTRAKAEAGARDSDEITLVHVLAGLIHSQSEAAEMLQAAGLGPVAVERLLAPPREDPATIDPDAIPFSDASKRWLPECVRHAVSEGGLDAIRSVHLLATLAASDEKELTSALSSAGLTLPAPGAA